MNTHALSSVPWQPYVWALLGFAGTIALVAILSPRLFAMLNAWSSVWVDVDRLAKKLDRRIDIDDRIIPQSRLIGVMTLIAAAVLAGFCMGLQRPERWIVLPTLGLVAATGLVALFSPRLFSRLAKCGSFWVDIDKSVDRMNHRIEIDQHVLRHCRLFGAVVLGVVIVVATLLSWWT